MLDTVQPESAALVLLMEDDPQIRRFRRATLPDGNYRLKAD